MLEDTRYRRKQEMYIRNQSLPVIMEKRSPYEAFNLLSPSDGTTLATLLEAINLFAMTKTDRMESTIALLQWRQGKPGQHT